ncbi:site-2 protease family protein [Pseudolysinimonas sp.]|uniref:M50 family metallopeptidase n=1 Tax=Pseudolysinimonas sp. TaxID=2680009 RepID=UPI00286AAC78|nr:site-2 protease family protein [Pseudolysinimonas sp.]
MESALLYLLGVVIVLVGLMVSIGLHEVGHLVPAKLFGVRVGQYMIGFGKTLFSKRVGETEYGLKMIPLGGYISMAGMFPPERTGGKPRTASTGFFDTMVNDARTAAHEGIPAGEEHRTFYRLPVLKRVIIMLGGPFMNLVLAFVFFGIVLVGFGIPQSTTTIGTVYECVVPADSTQTECTDDDPLAPAAEAGLLPGDRILAIDGQPIAEYSDVSEIVTASAGQQLAFEVLRDGERLTLPVMPLLTERPVFDDDLQPVENPDGSPATQEVGFIGIGYAVQNVQQPITAVPGFVGDAAGRIWHSIATLPVRVYDLGVSTFSGAERDPEGIIGVVGIGRLAGEITSLDTLPVADRAASILSLLGGLNLALCLFNLVPLLPLDGGHVAGAIWEGIRRGFAKLFRRPDPGPVDVARLIPITMAVSGVLAVLTVFVIFSDIVNPISLF